MAPSFNYLSGILHSPTSTTNYFFGFKKPPPGEFQYCGPHFLAAIRFAVKLDSKKNDGFTILEESAYESFHRSVSEDQKFLNLIASSLTQIRELFVVQTLYKYLSGINPNRVDIIASFIEFLVDIIERLSYRSFYWIIIPGGINIVCQRLKFLLFVIQDMPLQCTKQEGRKNILAEIECVVKEVGMFLYSFFFTANHISITKMDLELSALLSKIDAVEEIIKNHLERFVEQQEFTSSDLTSTSIYIVDSLLGDLNHLLDCKADLVPQVKDQIATLQEELYSCRSMLRDKELQQNKELEECEMQLIDLAYQAEHLIACFVAGEVPIWYLALKLPSFILRSKHIQDSLFNLKLNLGFSDLQVSQSSTKVSSTQEATQSISMTHDITVGFKQTRRQMKSELIGGPDRLQIIAIIGMGGLGKTTLARELYNESNVLLRFDRRSWCVVSQTYQKRKLLTDILNSISVLKKDEISSLKDDELADRVYKSLKRIRYLLVVDDIWNIEVWDDLKRYFPDDRNGSRILFTTRNKDVALEASSEASIHDLPLLLEDECWDLLQKKVFPNSICPLELQDVGKEIARNCKGLPLAVVGIAAILASMDNKKNLWQEVSTNLTSYISKDRDILELSYCHLPLHLKPCFLYLGMFEEDKEIPVKELLSLWVSEGLIPKNEHKISEDTAEDYLFELINRSMIQVTKRRSDNGVKTCTIHDLMRDMCLRVADKENFIKVINEKSSTYEQHHHILFDSYSYDSTSRLFGPHIRSLFCCFMDLSAITSSMKRLRVLKLSAGRTMTYRAYDGTPLEFLIQLTHLECVGRYLTFSNHMNLEFLSIRSSWRRETQLNMPKLRHLHLGRLPSDVPLKELDILPAHSLETLSGITIVDLEDEERLRSLSQLRNLKCSYGGGCDECSPDLASLTRLVSLNIYCGKGAKFKAINFPIHIKKLTFSFKVLSGRLLSSIGTLPHLEIFKLDTVRFEEMSWNTNDNEFQTLKFLKLEWVMFEEWNTSEDHFPVLERLVLKGCFKLKHLPSDLGNIPTLQSIEVLYCKEDVTNCAKHIREEQEEAGNEQLKVIISSSDTDE